MKKRLYFGNFWVKAIILTAIGVGLSFLLRNNFKATTLIYIVDMLFLVGMVFFSYGLLHMVGNAGMFAIMSYGLKCLRELVFGKGGDSGTVREGYAAYRESRKRHTDIPLLMIFAGGFFAASIAIHIIFG